MNFNFLTSDYMKVFRQWVPCKHNSLYNFLLIFMQLYTSFVHGLKMYMWFGFNPAVNFCHFSTLLTSSFFAGVTSTSPKFDLYFVGFIMCWLVLCEQAAKVLFAYVISTFFP